MGLKLVDVAHVRERAAAVVASFEADWAGRLEGAEIHHIGATALPSGVTKGDVDVNVRVDGARFGAIVDALAAELAPAQRENWTPTFASFSATGYALPLGVQVTAIGSPNDLLLSLRDRLRDDPDLLRRYDELKRAAAPAGPEEYWQAKDRFFNELTYGRNH